MAMRAALATLLVLSLSPLSVLAAPPAVTGGGQGPAAGAAPSLAAVAVLPPPRASYTASEHLLLRGDQQEWRVYHDGPRERREGRDAGLPSVIILRGDKGDGFALQPDGHMAIPLVASDPEAAPNLQAIATLPAQAIGTATVQGLPVTRYRVAGRLPRLIGSPDNAPPRGFEGEVWSTDDGIYVRVEGTAHEGGQDMDVLLTLTDIHRGPQPASLFELPADYRLPNFGPIDAPTPSGLRDGGDSH